MLDLLEIDYSEDAQGNGTFELMASVRPEQVLTVRAAIDGVLAWAASAFPGQQAPLDDSGEWDFDLQESREDGWHVFNLSISGTPHFCAAFRRRFAVD
ncbi:MAG: hypothetical protein Q7T70_16140 [Polaromonas sp.]|nr:hypothetical protein [Polaromonas sp.]